MTRVATLVFLFLFPNTVTCQIHWGNLSKIGIVGTGSASYKVMTRPSHQTLVIKLMPNITAIDNCTKSEISEYKRLLITVLKPVEDALSVITKNVRPIQTLTPGRRTRRFVGAVLAGVALGVATAAQITAGVALHQSLMNSQAIESLKTSLEKSNQAIEEIRLANKETILAVQGVQDYINNELVPSVHRMSCELVGHKLSLKLLRYYTEILSIFGPSLRDPIAAEISIQALSYALGGDINKILDKLGYSGGDFLAILESKGIKARVTYVDTRDYFIILSIAYPTLSEIKGVIVHKIEAISYNIGAQEWYTTIPRYVATQGYLISNFDETSCVFTPEGTVCSQNALYPMSPLLQECFRGSTKSCARTLVSGTTSNRFILSKGNLIANCASVLCKCYTTETVINQDPDKLLTVIASDKCPVVEVDGVTIQVGSREYPDSVYLHEIDLGPAISLEKLDVGTNLGNAVTRLENAKELLDASDQILKTVKGVPFSGNIYIALAACIGVSLGLVTLICCCKGRCRNKEIPASKINPGLKPDLTGTSKSYVRSL
uniref:Fusion glycoprotein F0 n=6 Tax=Morbillivirus caprinae TaxID=3052343 RepID=Q4PIR6_PPRV|nr:cell fusion protein - peste-des-petits-ruminants virus (strain 75/1) [Peste des petits ruminants virus]ADX95994.1 fusion protein [Peste des petits ruminants virus]AUP34039.1 fusion protein [Peste des petits ruminants virus]UTR29899.1 fusion protein [Peste des petits ruminants virus]UXG78353.1 fusion protein [Peste des petits ruminants virus]UXG78361.1 fusion protein [Peste des petits ruminants virus]